MSRIQKKTDLGGVTVLRLGAPNRQLSTGELIRTGMGMVPPNRSRAKVSWNDNIPSGVNRRGGHDTVVL